MSKRIKRYVDISISNNRCNFACNYCYVGKHKLFDEEPVELCYEPEFYAKALSQKRLGGTCLINICASGETLLPPKIIDIVRAFLEEGHYVMIVTNGSLTSRIEELANFPDELKKHLFLKISFHYLELKRLNLLETFCKNINIAKKAGISFTIEITPTDELEPYIDEIKEFSMRNFGAFPHFTIARDDVDRNYPMYTSHTKNNYKKIWEVFNSKLFDFKMTTFGVKRKEYCYAGDWSIRLELTTGVVKQCYNGGILGNIYSDIDSPINFEAIGRKCPDAHCRNSHSYMILGVIPQKRNLPTYTDLRNRVCADGSEWLRPEMKDIMSSRLWERNEPTHTLKRKLRKVLAILKA